MARDSFDTVFCATKCLSILMLKLCFMVWTLDLIRSANSTQITDQICKNAVSSPVESICCQIIVERDEHLEACTNQLNTSKSYSEENAGEMIQISKFIECVYKRRKYMKSDTRLNIGRVKAEANRLYQNDTLRKDFMINMYRYCAQIATANMILEEDRADVKLLLSLNHKPFFLFHYTCLAYYSNAKCPYFIWTGKTENDTKICTDFSAECVKMIKA